LIERLNNMNKYQQIPEAVVDLHGLTVVEAKAELERILKKGHAHIRVITGKGHNSTNGVPVLREFTKKFLSQKGIRFSQSKITDGGAGSFEVFLTN